MLSSTIRHGDLVIDIEPDGDIQINRQSSGQAIRLSKSEWGFILKVAEIAGWPVAPPICGDLKDSR